MVALQIISEEANAAFQGHELGTPGKIVQLRLGQGTAGALQEALGVHFVQGKIKVHFGQILLILSTVVGSEADGVAKVVDGEAGHHSVQVNDANTFAALAVNKDVVKLGVVVGHPQGELSIPQGLESHRTVRLPLFHKFQLRLYILHPAHGVRGHRCLQLGQTVLGVVEARNGLIEGIRGVVLKHPLKAAENPGGGGKQLRSLRGLEADGSLNEGVDTPGAALAVGIEALTVPGGNHSHGFPAGVTAGSGNGLGQIGSDTGDVAHNLVRMMESGGADTLENKPPAGILAGLSVDTEGVVDVAGAVADGTYDLAAKVKGGQGVLQEMFSLLHDLIPPRACRGRGPTQFSPRWQPPPRACLLYR